MKKISVFLSVAMAFCLFADEIKFSGTVKLPGGVDLAMVKIKAGTFMMGSPKDEPGHDDIEDRHRVALTKDYWLGKYEVTQGQWKALMGNNPSRFKMGDNYPVELVTWYETRKFCEKLNERYAGKLPRGYRFDLPTEKQWEYACRAGTTTSLNSGKDVTTETGACPNLDEVGWYDKNSYGVPHPVGEKRPNAWGLYDMHGNVAEWCRDQWGGTYSANRGGCWPLSAKFCRSAWRSAIRPRDRFYGLGFRLALVPVDGVGTLDNQDVTVKNLRKSAEQGNAQAQLELGHRYRSGKGVAKNLEEAVKWYRKSAEQGNAEAQNQLGICYRRGVGVEKNLEEAVKWYRKAAEQGNAVAQNRLGVLYARGEGIEKDLKKAVEWFSASAKHGNAWAQLNLGHCYRDGQGVKKDLEEAVRWYRKSAVQGNASAKKALEQLGQE